MIEFLNQRCGKKIQSRQRVGRHQPEDIPQPGDFEPRNFKGRKRSGIAHEVAQQRRLRRGIREPERRFQRAMKAVALC